MASKIRLTVSLFAHNVGFLNLMRACSQYPETGQKEGWVRKGNPTLLYYAILSIAGTAYSSLPEIKRLDSGLKTIEPAEIGQLIHALIFID